jgi:outer membrane biogenesis lipoprotein LolB
MALVHFRLPGVVLLSLVLGACSTPGKGTITEVDCKSVQSSCHHGRFGLIWKVVQANGKVEAESVSGNYEWRSGRTGPSQAPEIAYLEVSSTLGPSLGSARRLGSFYEVRAADGRVYLAQDWQSLFDLMFPVKLPAEALVQWMENPNQVELPPLPENWAWENQNGRYRVVFVENNTSGRIDLIPQGTLGR